MNLLVVNPNTTPSMTAKIGQAARAVAAADTVIDAVQPDGGPVSIEGYYDEAFAVPGVIAEIRGHPRADAVIIACFDDTGLDAARCITGVPVIGIGEAVITTLPRSIAALEHNLHKYGLKARCAKVRAADVPVLELENPASDAHAQISAEIQKALTEDGADAIVLGCAGMADLAKALGEAHGVPVIDGVAGAVKLAESLVSLGATTAKTGPYARPRAKEYRGAMAPWAPDGA